MTDNPDHHPLLGRLVLVKDPRNPDKTIKGQVIEVVGTIMKIRPRASTPDFRVEEKDVKPEFIDPGDSWR